MAKRIRTSTKCFFITLVLYFAISKSVFDNIYSTSKMIVDEEFHLPLGISYCKFDFLSWDPKVTTLPGLYLVSSIILGPLHLCTTYWLRFVSFGASIFNIVLFRILYTKYDGKAEWRNILSSFTLSMLPPLYFFANLYYTEIVSLTMILLMLIANERGLHFFASILGFGSIICRQTNVIWVAFLLGRYFLVELYMILMKKHIPRNAIKGLPMDKLWRFVKQLVRQVPSLLHITTLQFWLDVFSYSFCLLAFGMFLKLNGSIVVGDKSAHEATLHFPQLFYFSLFCMVFAWPHFFVEIENFVDFAKSHKKMIMIVVTILALIVYQNTLVHPYMLADNRHYVFYIWNRFYGRNIYFRFVMIPIYVFAWYVIIKALYDQNDVSFILLYLPCVVLLLVTQKLIDVRYYFIPYIIFKLRLKNTKSSVSFFWLECFTYLILNVIVLNIFYSKTIIWPDYKEPQRLIW